MITAISAALVPVAWVLLKHYVVKPCEKASKDYLPTWLHEILSKER